jgi:hypothetical protein
MRIMRHNVGFCLFAAIVGENDKPLPVVLKRPGSACALCVGPISLRAYKRFRGFDNLADMC